jgi:hypothetical protein
VAFVDRPYYAVVTREPVPEDVIDELYEALERRDLAAFPDLVTPEVFVLPGTAESAVEGANGLISDLGRGFNNAASAGVEFRIRSVNRLSHGANSERSAWVFDQVEVDKIRNGMVAATTPVRVTGLFVRGTGWRLEALHWSIPTPSNEEQRRWLRAGKLPAGGVLEHSLSQEVIPLADRLARCLVESSLLPGLYSTRPEAVTIGSTEDEIFFGGAAKEAWEKFVDLGPRLVTRGGTRGARTPDRTAAWLATHIDISFEYTIPYRFFYIWWLEDDKWRVVVSHDSVSMNLGRLARQM